MSVIAADPSPNTAVAFSRQDRKSSVARNRIRVALFCGGRGSATLIRELLRWPQVHLSLIVNAYDDGLSTGELRSLVPDMLGPSDFRKNLARLVNLHSTEQYALQRLLDHRFSKDFSAADIEAFELFVANSGRHCWLPEPLDQLFAKLRPESLRVIIGYLQRFLEHKRGSGVPFNYRDSSLGNLIFAGAYLDSDHNFNASIEKIAAVCSSRAQLINVTCGENRTLVALKVDGQLLSRESEIVGPQSRAPIVEFFLIERPLDTALVAELADLDVENKRRRLREMHSHVHLSPEANYALRQSDIIVYGPGTQFSSLMPSYCTLGVADAIASSRAIFKIFVVNLDTDHDIQGLTASDLVDRTLMLMDDPDNSRHLITQIFYDRLSESRPNGIRRGGLTGDMHKSAAIVEGSFESSARRGTHSGFAVVSKAIALLENSCLKGKPEAIDIYVDLLDRSHALDSLLQEFLDLPWSEHFTQVRLRLNHVPCPELKLPPDAAVFSTDYEGVFSEVDALLNWLAHGDSEYLVTLTGDGEYRLSEVLVGVEFLRSGIFGVIHGSRTQSRRQLHSALDSAYGEHGVVRFVSWCGAFLFTAAFGLLCRIILSDPFTGFRIYRRSRLEGSFVAALMKLGPVPASTVTRLLIRNDIEIAEIPVTYRTFRGFTNAGWRVARGLRNFLGILR